MAFTFAVDDVEPACEPAATVTLAEHVGAHLHLGVDGSVRVLPTHGVHPLMAAVHHAFADHRPLVLSPDAVWLTIAQGVAHHVRLHAEALRSRLVRHEGKIEIVATRLEWPTDALGWGDVVTEFRATIADAIGGGLARLFTCDFSTSGPAERVASEIVLMDAVSGYYDFVLGIICGIPQLTLLGTADDWRAIRTRIDVIAELELAWWTSSLAPILEHLVAAAEGRPDVEFFQGIYKPEEAYGWDLVTGWIARLYPYVEQRGAYETRNPLLALPLDSPPAPTRSRGYYNGPGIRAEAPPPGLAQALVKVRYQEMEDLVLLEGGLLAVEQRGDGALAARCGFLVRHGGSEVAAVVARIRSEHRALGGADDARWAHDGALRAFFREIGEAKLFEDGLPWRIVPPAEREWVNVADAGSETLAVTRVVDLPDETFLALLDMAHGSAVARLRAGAIVRETVAAHDEIDEVTDDVRHVEAHERVRTAERFEAIAIVGSSLMEVLAGGLASGGALALPERGRLVDCAPRLWDSPYHAAALLERLRRDHRVVEAEESRSWLLFDVIREGEVRVGDARWTLTAAERHLALHLGGERDCQAMPYVELPEGQVLARIIDTWSRRCIVRLDGAAFTEEVRAKAKGRRPARTRRISTQDLATIPVLGRSFVDVLTHALDTGELPSAGASLAEWLTQVPDG